MLSNGLQRFSFHFNMAQYKQSYDNFGPDLGNEIIHNSSYSPISDIIQPPE